MLCMMVVCNENGHGDGIVGVYDFGPLLPYTHILLCFWSHDQQLFFSCSVR